MKTERALQKRCMKIARERGWLAYKFDATARVGVPDVVLVGPWPRVAWVEFKHPNGRGRLRPMQLRVHADFGALNWYVHIIESVGDFERVIA